MACFDPNASSLPLEYLSLRHFLYPSLIFCSISTISTNSNTMSDDSDNDTGPSWSVMGDATCLGKCLCPLSSISSINISTSIDPKTNPDAIWPYCPGFPTAIIFTILFSIAMSVHIVQAANSRKRFCWVIIMAAIWETTGFALRAAGTQYQRSVGLQIFQQLLILLSPLWINAFVYMIFGRLVYYFVPEKKLMGIRATRLAMTFVWLDIVYVLFNPTNLSSFC